MLQFIILYLLNNLKHWYWKKKKHFEIGLIQTNTKGQFLIFFNGGEDEKNGDANRSFFDSSGLDGSSSRSSSSFIWEGSMIIIL